MKTILINTIVNFFGPPMGPARLYGYCLKKKLDVSFYNLNNDIYSYLLSEKFLKELLLTNSSRLFWSLSRDKFIRQNFGSILLSSSNGEFKKLLAEILLETKLGDKYNVHLFKDILLKIIQSNINTDNIPFLLLGNIEKVAKRIGEKQKEMDSKFFAQPTDSFLNQFRILLCGKAIIDAVYYPSQIDFGLGFQGIEYTPAVDDIIRATTDERHNYLIGYCQLPTP